MKRLIILKKTKIYLLLLILFSINSLGQNMVNENHMIIKFDQNSTFTFSASSVGCSFVTNIDCINAELWCIPDVLQIGNDQYVGEQAIADYFASMGEIVEYAEPDWLLEEFSTPNDPNYNQLWGMDKINAPQAWDVQTGNSSVIVGVIDSGVDWAHPDLIDNIWQNMGEDADGDGSIFEWNGSQWIFDPGDENGIDDDGNGYIDDFVGWDFHENDNDPYDICGHGTHVAGTIGAKGNNNTGVSGVCWDVQLMALKFLEWNPQINRCTGAISNSILALEYAVMNGAPITNNSYGGGPYTQAMRDALEVARQNDHLFVASAGNSTRDNNVFPSYPASYDNDNIVSVASTTSSDNISGFSNYGLTTVDLGAPGSNIYSTKPNNTYGNLSGTSMAAPHVAGAAALLLSECNSLTYQEIKAILMDSTDPISALSGKCVTGGRLNVNAAMESLPNFNCGPLSICRTTDSLALVALYNSTNGPNWTNTWDLSEPMDNWHGVLLNDDGCVSYLNLIVNGLSGTIPAELGNLSYLEYLNLFQNQLTGTIPPELGNLSNLRSLNLGVNSLTGTIPVEFGNLANLEILKLHQNELVGNIPAELGNLSNLEYLLLYRNELTGAIPSELGNLANLKSLILDYNNLSGCYPPSLCDLDLEEYYFTNNPDLPDGGSSQGFQDFCAGNAPCNSNGNCSTSDSLALVAFYNATDGLNWDLSQPMNDWDGVTLDSDGCVYSLVLSYYGLTGSIPAELGNLSKLQSLNLLNNELTGSIPTELGNLSNLRDINLGGNQLTGSIPSELGNLYNLEVLRLYNNQLTGNIPVELSNLSYLRTLELFNNELTGTIPIELGNLSNLRSLDLTSNELTGTIPIELGNLSNLENLVLSSNELTGTIPSELGNLSNLRGLYLSNNLLTGIIPVELGNLYNLEYLKIWSNGLTGTIPSELGNLSNLKVLSLSYNNLTGNIPIELGNLLNLERLSLNGNNLTSNIPSELGNLSNLKLLALDNNNLTGNVPPELGNLYNLEYFELWNNNLTGSIPSTLGNLSNLRSFTLAVNELTGTIPSELGNLSNLEGLSLAANELTGNIPAELGNLSNLESLNLSINNLSGCYPQSLCNLNLSSYDFIGNSGLPDGGSSQGFLDFCAGTAPPCGGPYCNAYELNLGPDVSLSCGGSVTLSTGLINMALTLWDYEGTLVGNAPNVNINAPGTYIAIVADTCGNTGIDTIIVNQSGDCVWPGDMNKDNIVNNYDVLSWGLDNGKTGPSRPGGNFDWEGQACTSWSTSGPNGVNDKHSDASGNGAVGAYDLNAITQNYGKVHGPNTSLNGNIIPSFIATSNVNMINAAGANNGEIILDLVLSEPISDVHGLAWSIDLDFNSDIKDISFVHNSDWFGTESSNLKVFYHYETGYNKIDIAITRTDGQLVSGDGLLGYLVITEDNVVPWDDPDYNISINIDKAVKIDNQGNLTYLGNNSNGLVAVAGGACPTFHLHNYNNYVDGCYQAENQITSSATIRQTAVVDYKAGDQFTINPGFNIVAGGEFKASIQPCTAFKGPSLKVINNKFIEINLLQDRVLPKSLHPIDNELIEAIFKE